MCVIIVKPEGVKIPSNDILNACYAVNSDGCGFVSPSMSYKGLNFRTFKRKLAKVPVDEPCIIHFRFATHGSVSRANCHPFNMGDVWFAHNGILPITPRGDMTDSQTAFEDIIYPAIQKYGFASRGAGMAINKIINGSKFAIMQGDHVRLYGKFIKWQGYYFSNLRFIQYVFEPQFDNEVKSLFY